MSDHGLEEQRRANRALRRLAADLGLGLVVGNDVHYPRREDAPLSALLLALAARRPPSARPYVAPCRASLTAEHWLKPPEAMSAAFARGTALGGPGHRDDRGSLHFRTPSASCT